MLVFTLDTDMLKLSDFVTEREGLFEVGTEPLVFSDSTRKCYCEFEAHFIRVLVVQ
jgi:hypothetical protein